MRHLPWKMGLILGFILAVTLIAGPVLGEKPPWAGGGKGNGQAKKKEARPADKDGSKHLYFTDDQRIIIHDYYAAQYRKGKKCPRGSPRSRTVACPRAR